MPEIEIQWNGLDYWGGTTKTKATMSSVNRSRGSCISSHWLVKVLVTMVKMEWSD